MTMLPGNWPTLLTPGLRKIWHERLRSREGMFRRTDIFPIDTSSRAFEEYQGVGELGTDGWAEFEKTRRVPYAGFDPNYLTRLTHRTFSKGLLVERELLEDNQYPDAEIPKSIKQKVEKLADSADVFREKSGADVFNNAFTDSGLDSAGYSVAGADGVGLVSTAHPLSPSNVGSTQSNEFTLALTADNVRKVDLAMQAWTDDRGELVSIQPDTLLVPPALEDQANVIVGTDRDPDSANNAINPARNKYKVEVWKYLTDPNAWFLVDSVLKSEHLVWLDRVAPEWQSTEDFDTIQAKYRGYMRFSRGWDAWQWIAGSNPS